MFAYCALNYFQGENLGKIIKMQIFHTVFKYTNNYYTYNGL